MSNPFTTRPALRWSIPAVATVAVVGAAVAWPSTRASADGLPARTAQQLLVDVQQAHVDGLSGTVSETASLGLPNLSGLGASEKGGTSPADLVSGTHTARVWTRGDTMSRVAVQAHNEESDVVVNGRDVWQWSSADRSVTHTTLPTPAQQKAAEQKAARQRAGHRHSRTIPSTPMTPQQAAQKALELVGPTTTVSTAANDTVAGRRAYELVLTPKDAVTRVASVRIAIDGETKVPLQVQVLSRTTGAAAISVGFTSVDFHAPDASVFSFTPPKGATVTTHDASGAAHPQRAHSAKDAARRPVVKGTGWSQVATGRLDLTALAKAGGASTQTGDHHDGDTSGLASVLALLPTASGSWGSGHVLDGTLVSVVVTDDGRYAVGAVAPSVLERDLPAR